MKNNRYKKLNLLFATIILIGTIICMIYDHRANRILSYLAVIPLILIPTIVNKYIYKTTEKETFIYYLFIFLSYFLGCSVDLYNKTIYYDSIVHFISGVYSMYLAIDIYKRTKIKNILIQIIFCFGLVFIVAGVWEILEYSMDTIFNMNLQHNIEEGVVDTMQDIILAFLGGLITYIIYFLKKEKTRK